MSARLDSVSKCFCVAKFKQVTLHLQNGMLHSCHHPVPHKIPLEELSRPSALANTLHLLTARQEMLAGKRPTECDYCWRAEDSGSKLSDRHFKSAELWARDFFDEAASSKPGQHHLPAYLEVSFSNKCNLKCSYCSPQSSSAWMQEIQKHGEYSLSDGEKHLSQFSNPASPQFFQEEDNPYIKAFWEWWPELYPALKVFRITGGEPLLSQNTFRVLDSIKENTHRDLQLAINSNLAVPAPVLDRFLQSSRAVLDATPLKRFTVYSSIDTWGAGAAYLRDGLDSEIWAANVWKTLETLPEINFTVMCTFNNLSISNFEGLLEFVLKLKNRFSPSNGSRITLDLSFLRGPEHQGLLILDAEHLARLKKLESTMLNMHTTALKSGLGFEGAELEKMRRIIQWSEEPVEAEKLRRLRKNFYRYFSELDRRRGTDFLKTFPEMRNFWNECQSL